MSEFISLNMSPNRIVSSSEQHDTAGEYIVSFTSLPTELHVDIIKKISLFSRCADFQTNHITPGNVSTLGNVRLCSNYFNYLVVEVVLKLKTFPLYRLDQVKCPYLKENIMHSDLSQSDIDDKQLGEYLKNCPNLKILLLSNCSRITDLSKLPAGLKKLYISCCSRITDLSKLPTGLDELHIYWCEGEKDLSKLPAALKELHLSACFEKTDLSKLPAALKELHISDCSGITDLSKLPADLKELRITNCPEKIDLSKLPADLKELRIFDCPEITNLSELPVGLKKLYISWCPGITDLSELPKNVKVFK